MSFIEYCGANREIVVWNDMGGEVKSMFADNVPVPIAGGVLNGKGPLYYSTAPLRVAIRQCTLCFREPKRPCDFPDHPINQ